jgi:RNA 2',3'-cyclic 3'-phosphodiesterase
MSRLFVAIWPPEYVREHVRELGREDWAGVRWTPEQNWHVTLRFLGDAEPDAVAATLSAATLPSAVATVSSEPAILGSHSVVLPVSGVDELAESVWAATESLGTQSLSEHFRGHLTIGRTVGRDKIVHTDSTSATKPDAGTFEVTEVALVESTLSAEGASYATIATFPTVSSGGR